MVQEEMATQPVEEQEISPDADVVLGEIAASDVADIEPVSDEPVADAVALALERYGKDMDENGIITLSSGVRIDTKPVPPWAIREALINLKEPEPPLVLIEEKGREEPNFSDPDYLSALSDFRSQQGMISIDLAIAMGTVVVEVPDGIPILESDEWIDSLIDLAVISDERAKKIRFNKTQRKLAWFKFIVMGSDDDIPRIMSGNVLKMMVKERDVESAMRSFPNRAQRRANR